MEELCRTESDRRDCLRLVLERLGPECRLQGGRLTREGGLKGENFIRCEGRSGRMGRGLRMRARRRWIP